ncbi:MAG: acyloxyacyl hydrolase [Saprospiraceae bacterium]|nr:acyloxyacyl hydrolase [Saprospiraceae bacterium]
MEIKFKIKKIVFVGVFSLLAPLIIAQSAFTKGLSLSVNTYYGKVIKHTSKIHFDIHEPSFGTDLSLDFQTYGKKEWQQWRHYPSFGITLLHYNFNNDILGNANAILPHLNISLIKRPKFSTSLEIGSGVAYISKPYNPITNPTNNAIGSHWNNSTVIKLKSDINISSFANLEAGVSLTHFSNGASNLPNFGVNIPAGFVGLSCHFPPSKQNQKIYTPNSSKKIVDELSWGFTVHSDIAFRESILPRGPKYPIYTQSLAVLYYLNKINRASIGFDYEFNRAVYEFGLHTYNLKDGAEARIRSRRMAVTIGDEFLYGNIGINLQMGFYTNQKEAFLLLAKFYNKFSLRIYTPRYGKSKLRNYAAVLLKTNLFNAEYIALGVGAEFN